MVRHPESGSLVEDHVLLAGGFQAASGSRLIQPSEHGIEQAAAVTLSLMGRIDPQHLKIPVLFIGVGSRHRLHRLNIPRGQAEEAGALQQLQSQEAGAGQPQQAGQRPLRRHPYRQSFQIGRPRLHFTIPQPIAEDTAVQPNDSANPPVAVRPKRNMNRLGSKSSGQHVSSRLELVRR